jgi:hypothetical protein
MSRGQLRTSVLSVFSVALFTFFFGRAPVLAFARKSGEGSV